MSRRHNRKNPHKTPPSQRNGNGHERTYQFTEPPPPPPLTDTSRIWITGGPGGQPPEAEGDDSCFQGQGTWDQGHPSEPPPERDSDGRTQAGFGSRGNRLIHGIRARLLFPDLMRQAMDERKVKYAARIKPIDALEAFLVGQMARGSVQSEFAGDQLLANYPLAVGRVDTRWEEDRRDDADRLGERLSKSPCRVARALGRTKYGALYLIDKLTSLGESIAANGRLDPQQRDYLFDILAVDPILRNGSARVPAGDDGPALAEAVEKERARLTTKIERSLNGQDLSEQSAARLGIVRSYDQETKNLRSNARYADRRYDWAWAALCQLRAGVDPSTIIDPETNNPIAPEAPAAPAPEAAPPGPAAPASPPPEPAASTSTFRLPAAFAGLPEEIKQMLILMAEADHRERTPADEETLLGGEPAGEPGPDLPG